MSLWSRRTGFARERNALSEKLARMRAAGAVIDDLTESNPTRCGLGAPELVALLGDAVGAAYDPQPLGLEPARAAVSAYYARRGSWVDPSRVVLTASTSEGYAWLFKLLCDPGDVVMAPRPSYPLFPFLAELESVELAHYPLLRQEGWRIDHAALERALDAAPRARAILLVHPGNPTGSYVADREALVRVAVERGLALVVDEVFWDYPHGSGGGPASFVTETRVPTFVLSGLSKVALLPQMKLGWMVVNGSQENVSEALERLELVADSYLSVSTAVQLAAPALLDAADERQRTLSARLAENVAELDRALASLGEHGPLRRLPIEGGWYALVEIPRTRSDDGWVEHLLDYAGVLVHPGYFFDMEEAGTMVVSLLLEPESFAAAIGRAVSVWAAG